jgi:hypothetical protein
VSTNTQRIIRDMDGNPIPQYYNPATDAYESAQGNNGAVSMYLKGYSVADAFSATGTVTHNFTQTMFGFTLQNDGPNDLSFSIGSVTITVKSGECFQERFQPFTSVTINAPTGTAWRAFGMI